MSAIKSPIEKKKVEYKRGHRTRLSRSPHAFRKYWPIKKAKQKRAHRRKVSQLLQASIGELDADVGKIQRKPLKKFGVMSLRDDLQKRRRARMPARPILVAGPSHST
jgi:hypothetical protein